MMYHRCEARIKIEERDMPGHFLMQCVKHKDHPGAHYTLEPEVNFTAGPPDGVHIRLTGRAEFQWEGSDVWIHPGLTVIDNRISESTERAPQLIITDKTPCHGEGGIGSFEQAR